MIKKMLIAASLLLLVSGCGNEEKQSKEKSEHGVHMLEVKINLPTEPIKVGEEVTLSADVSMGGKKVTDADDVMFEIRQTSAEKGEMVKVKEKKDGNYKIIYTFKTEGDYMVTAHVTANSMHNMPSEKITVEK